MESKNKLFGYVSSLSEFNKLKVSADIDNKTYTIGGGNIQQCAEGEVPDVRWHIVVFIEDVTRIWTHGKFYASANAKLSDNYSSPVYVEVKDVETGEILFNPAKPGETIEEAILQLDTNISTLLAEILKNEEVISTALNEHNLSSGFNTHGKYVVNESAKYISTATSLSEADTLLDTAIANIASNIEILSGDLSDLFIPTKTSDLTNDSGFLTSATLPKNISHFNNDAGYITSTAIPKSLSSFTNDMDYITSDDIPTKVSEFTNDAKYQTESDVKAAIDALIDNAPGTLDTLGEIAEVLKDNQDGIGALVTEIAKKANTADVNAELDKKADKETVNDLSDTVDDVKDSINTIAGTTNSVYTANASAKYINNATSLVDADNKLDAAIAGVASELSNLSKEVEDIVIPTNVSAFTNDAKYAYQGDIPTKVSQLENDSKYLTTYYTPTKLSEFTNDANYALKSEIPTKVAQLTDASNYALASNIPTNVSQLTNDSNYATVSQIPTSTNQLTNDSGFITINEVPKVSVPQNLSEYTNDAGFITISDVENKNYITMNDVEGKNYTTMDEVEAKNYITLAEVPEVSKNLAEYDNSESKFVSESELTSKNYTTMDEVEAKNYITLAEVPEVNKDLSQYDNSTSKFVSESELTGKNYITMGDVEGKNYITINEVPTNVSAFTNDANYATKSEIPTTVAELTDASDYAKKTDLPTVPTNVSAFTNDANYATKGELPTKVSQLENDSKYLTSYYVPTKVSEFENDANYITSAAIPTKLSAFTNDCTYMTEAQVEAKVASLVDSAPQTLDTLNELAAALGDDPNFATTVSTEIGKKADSTYVAEELEKKANDKLSQDSVIYPNIIYDGAELFTNTYANVSLEQAILNVDKNTKTLAEEVIKNEEVISTALNEHNIAAGFTTNGKYEQQTDANYIDSATSLSEADLLLDAAIKDVADIVSVISGNVDGIDIPKNVTDLEDHANYVTKTELDALSYVTSSALEALNYVDSTYVTSELEKKADLTYVTSELEKKADLTYVTSELEKKANNTLTKDSKDYPTVKNFETGEILFTKVTSGDTLEDAIIKTDSNTATLVEEVLKNELVISTALNKINSSAGFNENAEYVKNESANYIQSANSLKDADNLLDAAIKTVANSVDQKIGSIDFSTYVTKQQLVDAAYITAKDAVSKQQLVDASYVTSTTLAGFDYADKAYVSSYVGQEIAKLVDTAPQTLNTLNELADALGNDPNFATTVMTEIGKKADSTYVAEELEKKADAVITGEFDEYPVLKNTHTGEELFVNCHDGIAISDAIHNIDKNTYTLVGEILKNEEVISNAFNKINTSAGFDTNGIYHPAEDANFISEATSLKEAIDLLDANMGNSSIEHDGAYFPIVRDITTEEEKYLFSYLYAGDSVTDAIYKTDRNVATLAYEVIRNEYVVSAFAYQINNSIGLDEYAEYKPKTSTNYIGDAKSLVDADNKLDAAIKSANDTINSLNDAISNINIPTTVAELNDSSDYYKKSELTRVSQLYNDSGYQRKGEVEDIVSTYIAGIINSAPETLDTLNELATALGNDENFATNVTNQIASKANNTISYDGALYPAVIDVNADDENVQIFVNTYSGTSLEQYVRNVDDNVARLVQENLDTEYVVSTAINKLNMSAGFSEQAEYVQNASANYIQGAASLADADNMLDTAIKAVADSISTHGGYLYLEDFDKTNLQNALTLALSSLEEGEDAIIDCTYFKGEHTITGNGFIINNPVKLIFGGIDIIHDNANGTNLFTFNTNNISIVGLNRNTDKSKIDNGATIFRMTNPDTTLNGYHIKSRGNKNLEIKDITFVGLRTTHGRQYNNASYPLDGVGGIYIEKAKPEVTEPHNTCNNIRIENILIAGSKAHGIYIDTPILSTFKNIRLSDCGGHGIFVNAGTSLLLENIYCSSANFAGFCIYGATYVSLNNCVSESSGIGFWIRSSFNVTLTSPGVEATRTFGGTPWRLSQPISEKYGLGLTTLASDNSTIVDIVDVTETSSRYFIGYGILITGGRSINIFTPYIKTIAQSIITEAYPSGTSISKTVKYINVLDNNRETYILNPSFKELSDSETPGIISHEIGIGAEVEHLELVYSTDETILTGELDSTTYVTNSDLRAPIYCKSVSSVIRSGKTIVTNYSTPNAPTTAYEFTNKEYVDAAIKVVDDKITTVPTNVSAFTNDANYVTTSALKMSEGYTPVVYEEVADVNNEGTYIYGQNSSVKAGETFENAINKIDKNVSTLLTETLKNEHVTALAIATMNESCGFGTDMVYDENTNATVISEAKSLQHADRLLDEAIGFHVGCSTSNTGVIPTTKHICMMSLENDTALTLDGVLDAGKEIILIIENISLNMIDISFNFGSNTYIQHYYDSGFGMNGLTSARVSIVSTGTKNYVHTLWHDANE